MLPAPEQAAAGSLSAPPPLQLTPEPIDAASYLFDDTQLRTYNLIVAQADLNTIDQNPTAEMYVPAGLEFEGKTYGPYRMRYKGSVGAFFPPCTLGDPSLPTNKLGKCSIKVDFVQGDPQSRFYGLAKLNFHSMGQDPAMLRERLSYSLFREMGVVAPRAAHARLLINGKLEGLFALVEQIDGRFTSGRFSDGGEGNLYKEVWPIYDDSEVYVAALETNTKQPHVQRMVEFKAAIDTGATGFASFIDRDYLLRYLAVDRVIVNDDGIFHFWCYAAAQGNNPGEFGNHNYYWYEAAAANRFWLIPWDLDMAFEAHSDIVVYPAWTEAAPCVCGHMEYGTQRPASCDKLVSHFQSWLDDYDRKVDEFLAGPFQPSRVTDKLDRWAAQIESAVSESAFLNAAPSVSSWKTGVSQLKQNITSARQHRGYAYP
jgi:spore coat protein CotH